MRKTEKLKKKLEANSLWVNMSKLKLMVSVVLSSKHRKSLENTLLICEKGVRTNSIYYHADIIVACGGLYLSVIDS